MLFLLNRSPYLEDLTEELVNEVGTGNRSRQWSQRKVMNGLYDLGLLVPKEEEKLKGPTLFDQEGMAPEWFAWCMAWYERAVDLALLVRQGYVNRILAVGRWLQERFPEIREPSQWTEDLALCFRSEVCSWIAGQYVSEEGRRRLSIKGMLGHPMRSYGIAHYLTSMRRYLTDLTKRPYAVNGAPAHRISLDFVPREVLTTPSPIRKALDAASPRDIAMQVWAKLAIAAATLSANDLPRTTRYPLSFYRALALVWVTSARRPNEITRLRLDCLREEWAPDMLDEDGQPVEQVTLDQPPGQSQANEAENKTVKLFYLHIPAGKNRGPFWIWIPDYVAAAINDWKRERPKSQRKLFDPKEREEVDYLFCYQDLRVGTGFINEALIPTLCARAGVDQQDATGKITGHRGRSTRLTLLRRRGVSLEDLAEYAGHTNTRTIRRYARQHPLQLHRIIRDADDVSRIIEGVVDVQAAVQGIPALRWFIGYDADGEPMYCGNQLYITCPHRLDCERCGMFIGGEKAKLLHESENTLPITSKVPMTPIEQCIVSGDQIGEAAYRAALQQVPAPEAPDIHLIFNPEGLSYEELKRLALLGTPEALDKLHQALEAHEKRLEEIKQYKTGRSALVGAQRKRINFIQELLAASSQYRQGEL
jgi:integrase